MSQRKILLLEPNYKNKYPPMGLMKLATYYRSRGDDVRFYKGYLKNFAAQLLLDEYRIKADVANNETDSALFYYIIKCGTSKLIEYILSGKFAPLEAITKFSSYSSHCKEQSLASIQERLLSYRLRYKNEDYPKFDVVCVATLFTFYWKETIETINFAKKICAPGGNVFVGGIAASLVPAHIEKETGVSPHIGLLDRPYALDSDEKGNIIIDQLPLDYSILEETDYRYPTENAYFGYMTRGCINRCSFCAVPRLEPEYQNYIPLHENLKKIEECFGAKKDLLLMDNNVFASDRFDQIVDEIKECGFASGSYYVPPSEYDIAFHNFCEGFNLSTKIDERMFNGRAYSKKLISVYDEIAGRILSSEDKGNFYQRREELGLLFPETVTRESVIALHELAKPLHDKYFKKLKRIRFIDFNQGLDGRLADANKMKKVSEIAIRPLRIAFDHWSMKDTYVQSIKTAAEYGITNLSNYLLYNFKDHPDELYNRMRLNIDLCEDLEVTIYSFPMKYHPIDDPAYFRNRDYIGMPHWNRKFIRSIQAVLNSTHGKIGRGRSFFEAAFGKNLDEFHKILWMPEALIIQRYKYDMQKRHEYFGNKPTPYDNIDDQTGNTTAEWWTKFCALNSEQRASIEPIIAEHSFSQADITVTDPQIAEVLRYYQIQRDGK